MWLVFVAYLLLRKYGGAGSEKLSAVLALFGMANVPFVYWSVNVWRTVHPEDIGRDDVAAVDGPAVPAVLARIHGALCAAARRRACASRRCARRSTTYICRSRTDMRKETREKGQGKRESTIVALLLGVCLFAASAIAQQQPPTAPDGFVPASSLPGQEQLPAAPLVIAAYSVVWLLGVRLLVVDLEPHRARRARPRRGQPPDASSGQRR